METRKEEKLELSQEYIEKLLPWFGYGHFRDADIVFLGNEEGLGGYPIQATIGRTKVYGNDENTWINGNWKEGYWDETGHKGYLQLGVVTNHIREEMGLPAFVKKKDNYFPILDFQARILLSIEEPDYDWFQLKSWYEEHDPKQHQKLESTIQDLYSDRLKVKAALVDWRPLPRSSEEDWPYTGIDENKYLAAFSLKNPYFGNVKRVIKRSLDIELLDSYSKMLYDRIQLMKTVFSTFPFHVLIGAGDLRSKKRLLKFIFAGHNLSFKRLPLQNGKYYEIAELNLSHRKLNIILTTFFNHRNNCLQLVGLRDLTEHVIKPLLNKKV
jgi:hypothetical protein